MGQDAWALNAFREFTPKANKDILEGITVAQMNHYEGSIDLMWKTVAKDFPKEVVYLGYRRCTPEEEVKNEPRQRRSTRPEVDIAANDIYMTNYRFGYVHPTGEIEEFPVYLFLPFVRPGGIMNMSGSRWQIAPMLGDVVLSFEAKRIFCQFSRAKFHINNSPSYTIWIDGQALHANVPWSVLYNINSTRESIKISLLHYVFAKYGLRGGFKRYLPEMEVEFFDEDPPESLYPKDQYVRITGSKSQAKPIYGGTTVVCVVRKSHYEAAPPWFKTFIASTFFVLDRFGKGGGEQWGSEMRADPQWSENIEHWRRLMGLIIWERSKQPAIIVEDINKHMDSLDRYIDDIVRPRAERIGFKGDNLYDFFIMAVQKWEDWQLNWYKISAPLHEKEINVLYQVNNDMMQTIFKFFFDLQNEAAKGPIGFEQLKKLFKDKIKSRMIFFIRKKSHRYVASFSYAADQPFTRITCVVVPQKGNSSGNDSGSVAGTRLHASLPEVTSPFNLTKKDSSGLTRFNPFLNLENFMYVLRDQESAALTERTQLILDQEMKDTGEEEVVDVDDLIRNTGGNEKD